MKISKEVKTGIVVVGALALLYFGVNYLKGINVFSHQKIYYAKYNRINGLEVSNPVVLNGYKVGQIKSISIIPHTNGKLLVSFLMNVNYPLPKDTKARLESANLLGSMQLALLMGSSSTNLSAGDTLGSEVEGDLKEAVNAQIRPLKNKAENLISSVDSVLTIVQAILNKDAQHNLAASFTSLHQTMINIEKSSERLDSLMINQKGNLDAIFGNIRHITENIDNNQDKLNNIIGNFSSLSDTLAQAHVSQTFNNINKAVSDVSVIIKHVKSGQGSMGQLIYNDTLYTNLQEASGDLDALLQDMKVHPARYVHFSVFGKRDKGLKLSKKDVQELKKYLKNQ